MEATLTGGLPKMPWPPAVTVITVNGRIVHANAAQTPAVGFVRFTTPNVLRDIADDVILVQQVTQATLDINGEFTVDLPATNDPDIEPVDWAIKVFVSTDAWREQFFIQLDYLGANPIEFADIPIATEGDCGTGLVSCVTVAQLNASAAATLAAANAYTDAEIAALPPDAVLSVNGDTGVVVLDAADVGADAAGSAAAVLASSLQKAANLSDLTSVPAAITSLGLDDVVRGPAAATDMAVARFDGVTGELIKDTASTTITDAGELVNRGDVYVRKADVSGEFAQRVSGGGLDYDAAGYDWFFSVWTGTGVGLGVQRSYIRAEQGAQLLHGSGRWIWATGPFGAAVHALDPITGVAELGGKNGLAPLRLCGQGAVAGSPAAGAWDVGDLMLDSVGEWWLCTVAGTPGTWVTGP